MNTTLKKYVRPRHIDEKLQSAVALIESTTVQRIAKCSVHVVSAILIFFVCSAVGFAQSPTGPAATLSPEVAIYESFRAWVSKLPRAEQMRADVLERYRTHLSTQGKSSQDIDHELEVIAQQGDKLEIDRWNRILTAEQPRFNTQPNTFLVERVKGVKPGKALDVGMGQGRNAIYLAQQGWDVTGFDLADKAVEAARAQAKRLNVKLDAVVADEEKFDWGVNRWDLIVLSYVGVRENAKRVMTSLKPGGLVIIEGAHLDATKTQSIGSGVVYDNNELIELFPGFRVLRYEDELGIADFGVREMPLVRMCAQKIK